jgi:hypothetical protein
MVGEVLVFWIVMVSVKLSVSVSTIESASTAGVYEKVATPFVNVNAEGVDKTASPLLRVSAAFGGPSWNPAPVSTSET